MITHLRRKNDCKIFRTGFYYSAYILRVNVDLLWQQMFYYCYNSVKCLFYFKSIVIERDLEKINTNGLSNGQSLFKHF